MSAATESKLLNWGKGILTALLILAGVNGAQVYTDPVGALTTEIKTVRAQIQSIETVALEVKAMRTDVNSLSSRLDADEEKFLLLEQKFAEYTEPKRKAAKK